jgi:hypothetical protein
LSFNIYPVKQTQAPPLTVNFLDESQTLQEVALEQVKHP